MPWTKITGTAAWVIAALPPTPDLESELCSPRTPPRARARGGRGVKSIAKRCRSKDEALARSGKRSSRSRTQKAKQGAIAIAPCFRLVPQMLSLRDPPRRGPHRQAESLDSRARNAAHD